MEKKARDLFIGVVSGTVTAISVGMVAYALQCEKYRRQISHAARHGLAACNDEYWVGIRDELELVANHSTSIRQLRRVAAWSQNLDPEKDDKILKYLQVLRETTIMLDNQVAWVGSAMHGLCNLAQQWSVTADRWSYVLNELDELRKERKIRKKAAEAMAEAAVNAEADTAEA